jgi:hypothetical protein
MAYELIIIAGGILFGLIGFIIGALLVRRAYKQSPSITHYKRVIDILTLRKLHNKLYPMDGDIIYDKKKSKTGEDHIEHYENMRDKLTIRKKKEFEVSNEGGGMFSGGGMIGNLIGGFIVIFIGVSLLPVVMQQTQTAINNSQSNMTSPSMQMTETMLKIVPVFFGIAILGVVIAIVAGALRTSGVV